MFELNDVIADCIETNSSYQYRTEDNYNIIDVELNELVLAGVRSNVLTKQDVFDITNAF